MAKSLGAATGRPLMWPWIRLRAQICWPMGAPTPFLLWRWRQAAACSGQAPVITCKNWLCPDRPGMWWILTRRLLTTSMPLPARLAKKCRILWFLCLTSRAMKSLSAKSARPAPASSSRPMAMWPAPWWRLILVQKSMWWWELAERRKAWFRPARSRGWTARFSRVWTRNRTLKKRPSLTQG